MSVRTFDSWELPPGVAAPPGTRDLAIPEGGPTGVQVRCVNATPGWITEVTDALLPAREALRGRPAAESARALGAVGAHFLDPEDPVRAQALELLPSTSGLSPEMAAAVLHGMAADWTEERLLTLLRSELGHERVLDGFASVEGRDGDARMAVGPALCTQIVAGSVPGVGVSALVRSLLLKGPTLLKPGHGDVVLPVLFARALREIDPVLADALAVVYWPGGAPELDVAALEPADVVVAYGSDETVEALRGRTPVTARFVAYHHRVSVGVIGQEALVGDRVAAVAMDVARAVAMFDHRGCVSPQIVFVEHAGGDFESVIDFGSALAGRLGQLERQLPSGPLDPAESSALHQLRGTAELLAASGAVSVSHGGAAPWTVIVEKQGGTLSGCAGRTVIVRPFSDLEDLRTSLRPLARHLQTVGIAGLGDRTDDVATALGALGASRVVPFGEVPFPPPWWHHDGRGPLLDLVRWVDLTRE